MIKDPQMIARTNGLTLLPRHGIVTIGKTYRTVIVTQLKKKITVRAEVKRN